MKVIEHIIDESKLKAIGNEVIVLVDPIPESSKFIICPEMGGKKSVTGKVISIGDSVNYAKIGDRVFFTRFTGKEFLYDDKKYSVLKEIEIFAFIPDDMECVETANSGR